MRKPHKHAELIKAWADGAEIEYRIWGQEEWVPCSPVVGWYPSYEYRIKPEPKPDVVYELRTYQHSMSNEKDGWIIPHFAWPTDASPATLRLVYDSETGKLKSAEVL